jgi:hypothetical protein
VRSVTVEKEVTETVGAAAATTVGGTYEISVSKDSSESVGALKAIQVTGARSEGVRENREEKIGGDDQVMVGGDFESQVDGAVRVKVEKNLTEDTRSTELKVEREFSGRAEKIEITADQFELMVGGKVVLSLDKSGSVMLAGSTVTVGGAVVSLKGSPLGRSGPGTARQKRLQLKKLEARRWAPAFAAFTLVDQDGAPVVNQKFMVELPDGARRRGATDGDGKAKVPATKPGTYRLVLLPEKNAAKKEPLGQRSKLARTKGALLVEIGVPRALSTSREQLVELPERRSVMTIAFLASPTKDPGYPRYLLESDDGSYRSEQSVQDAVKGERFEELRFVGLRGGKRYKLTRWHHAGHAEVVFEGLAYADIVDRHRPAVRAAVTDAAFLQPRRKPDAE